MSWFVPQNKDRGVTQPLGIQPLVSFPTICREQLPHIFNLVRVLRDLGTQYEDLVLFPQSHHDITKCPTARHVRTLKEWVIDL